MSSVAGGARSKTTFTSRANARPGVPKGPAPAPGPCPSSTALGRRCRPKWSQPSSAVEQAYAVALGAAFPLTRAEGWHSRPEDVLQYPVRCRSTREKSGFGQPFGDKDERRGRAYTNTKKVVTGCLTIHHLSGETAEAPTSAAGSAMIGTPLDRGHHEPAPDRPKPAPGPSPSPATGRRHQLCEDVGSMVADGWD